MPAIARRGAVAVGSGRAGRLRRQTLAGSGPTAAQPVRASGPAASDAVKFAGARLALGLSTLFEDYAWTLQALVGFAMVLLGNYIVLSRRRDLSYRRKNADS